MKLQELKLKIKDEFKNTLIELGYFEEGLQIELESPKDKSNGDYSSNIAMKLARIARKAPFKIAEEIVDKFDKTEVFVSEIKVANPGFINIYLDKAFLTEIINDINSQGEEYGTLDLGKGERLNIEYVSVNPTGSLHIGHARGASAGDSLSRIMKKAGYDVTREYYVNDAGNQINNLALSIQARYLEICGIPTEMPKDGYHGPEIIESAKRFFDEFGTKFVNNENAFEFFKENGVQNLLNELIKDLKDFGVEFDVWFSEKTLYENNLVAKTVEFLKENNFTYEFEGALWLKTSKYNDEKDRVIVKSDGTYTYVTPDIAYHKNKLERGFTMLIDILGGDHHGYIDRITAALEMVGGKSGILEIEILQMVKVLQNGEEVKMSKRSGKAITLRDLIDEVGVDPIRYFFAMRSLNTHMDLDLDLALKQTNENPVYYVQYAHARINSIFNTAKLKGFNVDDLPTTFTTLSSDKAFELISLLANFEDALRQSAIQRAPHKVTNYINSLASAFHSFYNDEQVITADHTNTMERLALLKATKNILKIALNLVGVSAPNKM
ncbi:MAG: Arginine--tRNA ligase [Candidatus Izimaplasma bacterium HR2]|nr:MAG: Arginine--tRNA ligase [Candidatus Izimaplasma bacterium HR2]